MAYLYETHLHTSSASKCAVSGGADYIAGYKEKGYSGIIVTDHFYNGNCALNKYLPWETWVDNFCKGYEEAKKEGDKQGLSVFFGWEETFDSCDDYLIYGLDKEWLLKNPQVKTWTRKEQYETVKAAGGCVVQAHPFRQRYYISRVILSTGCVDGIEAVNGGHEDVTNDALAFRYAQKLGKTITAGSDIHDASDIYYGDIFGVYTEKKLESISDYVNIILENKVSGLRVDTNRIKYNGNEKVALPVEIRDNQDKIIKRNIKDYL